ncbi:MAG: hypothetical protein AAF125_05230 [Chloroflexota bacterium]
MTDYLLITHVDEPRLSLLDSHSLNVIRQFDVPGRVAVLGASSDGRYGFAVHRDDDCVTVIDAERGVVTAICAVGQQPTHFHAHNGHCLIFNDGDGSVVIFDELNIPDFKVKKVKQPDHGSALLLHNRLLVGYLRMGCVEVYDYDAPQPLHTFDGCTTLHGAAQVGDTALFGYRDGVLIVRLDQDNFTSVKLANPDGTPDRVRVGLFATHPLRPVALGNFGHGLALIDLETQSIRAMTLPEPPIKFSFDEDGNNALILTCDGNLRQVTLGGHTRRVVPATTATIAPKGPDKQTRPTFTLGGGLLHFTDPERQSLVQMNGGDLSNRAEHSLDFPPSNLIYLRG